MDQDVKDFLMFTQRVFQAGELDSVNTNLKYSARLPFSQWGGDDSLPEGDILLIKKLHPRSGEYYVASSLNGSWLCTNQRIIMTQSNKSNYTIFELSNIVSIGPAFWRSHLQITTVDGRVHSFPHINIFLNDKYVAFLMSRARLIRSQQNKEKTDRGREQFKDQHRQQEDARREEEQQQKTEEEKRHRFEQEKQLVKDERYYGKVLGLKGRITKEDVKHRYIELCQQYHPDKVNHLGSKLKELAEKEMKEINEAYDYFEKKYGI
jgi:DnaJ-domain-containing protein 1